MRKSLDNQDFENQEEKKRQYNLYYKETQTIYKQKDEKTNKKLYKSFAARDTRRHQRSAMRCGKVPSSAGVSYTFTYLQVFHSHALYTNQKLFSLS